MFVDDNPFERNIVRRELPMVAVPELPDDPALYAACLADAGYFEGLASTAEDLERTRQYQANRQREAPEGLDHGSRRLSAQPGHGSCDGAVSTASAQQRIVQLINKTNQFNLTTRRYTEEDDRGVYRRRRGRCRTADSPARPLRRQRHHRHHHRPHVESQTDL